jgi:hypothetical protein
MTLFIPTSAFVVSRLRGSAAVLVSVGTADQRPFLALAGTRTASMNAARAGDTWRRPG